MLRAEDHPPGHDERAGALVLLRRLWQRRLIVLAGLLVGVAAAAAITVTADRQYTSTAQLVLRDPGFDRTVFGSDLFQSSPGDPGRDTSTAIAVLRSAAVTQRVASSLDIPTRQVRQQTEITTQGNSDLIEIAATTTDPALSARLANAVATEYIAFQRAADQAKVRDAKRSVRRSLTTADAAEREGLVDSLRQLEVLESLQTGNADLVARAEPSSSPSAPQSRLNVALGGITGLILGAGIALLVGVLDRRLRSPAELEEAFGVSLLTGIPRGGGAVSATGTDAEPYRVLRENLRFLSAGRRFRVILVTSADAEEGKTTVALNLARALSATGRRVLLIDADLRRPAVGGHLASNGGPRVDPSVGLSKGLVSDCALEELIVRAELPEDLYILPSGPLPPNPAELLSLPRMGELLKEGLALVDTVIIDSAPLLPVSDTQVLLDLDAVDGVLVVARMEVTTRDRASQARRVLERSGKAVLGLVVTGLKLRSGEYHYYQAEARGRSLNGDPWDHELVR